MVKQVNWELKLQKVGREIDQLKDLIATMEEEKLKLEEIVSSGGFAVERTFTSSRVGSNIDSVVERTADDFTTSIKRGPGRPKGSKNKATAAKVEMEGVAPAKRGPGRPKGSKNKKNLMIETEPTVSNESIEQENDLEDLPSYLEEIGQSANRPIKLEDFVKILRREGLNYDSKVVRVNLNHLVHVGKFIQNDDQDRSYEYVREDSVCGF